MDSKLHLENLRLQLKQKQISMAVVSDSHNIQYLSGFYALPCDDAGILVITSDEAVLILPGTAEEFEKPAFISELIFYENYNPRTDFDKLRNLAETLQTSVSSLSIKGHIGIEESALPVALLQALEKQSQLSGCLDIADLLKKMRMVKTEGELACIRRSVAIADIGHKTIREKATEGESSEIEIFNHGRARMEQELGERVFLKADILSGQRTLSIGGSPTERVLVSGELLIADLIPCVGGYWADTTSTTAISELTKAQSKIHAIVKEALAVGVRTARPGIAACELDAAIRGFIEGQGYGFPHHSGHGFGLADFEPPVIGPENKMLLEENMVLTIEPGIYLEGAGGIRLEDDIIVTSKGAEVLSGHSKELS